MSGPLIEQQSDWEERAKKGDGQFAIACALIAIAKELRELGKLGDELDSISRSIFECRPKP
jgi:hypothetical protein